MDVTVNNKDNLINKVDEENERVRWDCVCCPYENDKEDEEDDLFTRGTLVENDTDIFRALEMCASWDFIEYVSNNFNVTWLMFHPCNLESAINDAFYTPLEEKKTLLLYFHNKNDEFSNIFCENITQPEVKGLLNKRFYLFGWNVEDETYHPALIKALNEHSVFSDLILRIESKQCCAVFIMPSEDSFVVCFYLEEKISSKAFLSLLQNADNNFLNLTEETKQSPVDLDSRNYQELMLYLLGDRDYDSFEPDEHDLLKRKIGYALYGPPPSAHSGADDSGADDNGADDSGGPLLEGGNYDEKQNKKIEFLYNKIVEQNNLYAELKNRVVISFIYNCTEPLPAEKKKRAKNSDYNPDVDVTSIPVFVLPKCRNCEDPCRIFIDDIGRVYRTWDKYLKENQLDKCKMVLPLNGRYQVDDNGKVLLETHLSPACNPGSKILHGADIASAVGGLASGGVFVAAAIPAIAVAPAALLTAGVAGLGIGLYSVGRSIHVLVDRTIHKESLSFANSEARGAYLNIVAGSLAVVGGGANAAISKLAAKGFQIGKGATVTCTAINMANVTASGAGVVNSGYEVIDQWVNEDQRPSVLTMVQLGSSILFFGHALYSFKTSGAIVDESQAQALKDYKESLRSNRHRKTFNKMIKETIRQNGGNVRKGQARVIKSVIKIANKDEVFATLTRLNKKMNENKVRFSADNAGINLNGVNTDMATFVGMDNKQAVSFLQSLPSTSSPSQNDVTAMTSRLELSFNFKGVMAAAEIVRMSTHLVKIFGNTKGSIKEKIINTVAELVAELGAKKVDELLFQFIPGPWKYVRLFNEVNNFFQGLVDLMETGYQCYLKCKKNKGSNYKGPVFINIALEKTKRLAQFFDLVTKKYFRSGNRPTKRLIKDLVIYLCNSLEKKFEDLKKTREYNRGSYVKCPDCRGEYYKLL